MAIANFINNPNKFLLYVDKGRRIQSVEKGFFTWIKANITDRESFNLEKVISVIRAPQAHSEPNSLLLRIKAKVEKYHKKGNDAKAQKIVVLWNQKCPSLKVAPFKNQAPPSRPKVTNKGSLPQKKLPIINQKFNPQVLPSQQIPVSIIAKFKPIDLYAAQLNFNKSEVFQYLNSTSDHTWKTFKINTFHHDFKIGTWNLMNRCARKSVNPNGAIRLCNNPVGKEEDDTEYFSRKLVQLKELRWLISGGAINLDAMALQEVDFYKNGSYALYLANLKKPLTPQQVKTHEDYVVYLELYLEFNKMIAAEGWKVLESQPNSQPLLVIYNAKKLETSQARLTPCFVQNNKTRGGEVLFNVKGDPNQIAVTCLHLDYTISPQQAVEDYQQSKIKQDVVTIALGDLNRSPGNNLDSAIIDCKYPTNVDAKEVDFDGNNDPNTLTLKDARDPRLNKAYDAAFVSPTRSSRVTVFESEMTYFEETNEGIKVKRTNLEKRRGHQTAVGKPWKKGTNLDYDVPLY